MSFAGHGHTVLLRSDGRAVSCGFNGFGQCNIPDLPDGVTYSQVSAGYEHTVLLRSDGRAVACGENGYGRCNISSLRTWAETLTCSRAARRYVPDSSLPGSAAGIRVLQLSFSETG